MTREEFNAKYEETIFCGNATQTDRAEYSDSFGPDLDALIAAETAKAREEQREACAVKAAEYDDDVRHHGGPDSWVPSVSVRAAPLIATPLADEIANLKKELAELREWSCEGYGCTTTIGELHDRPDVWLCCDCWDKAFDVAREQGRAEGRKEPS